MINIKAPSAAEIQSLSGEHIIRDETGAQSLLGYVLDVSQPDKSARCMLVLDERHMNRHGVLHGGISATLLDNACGATGSLTADDTGRIPFVTISFHTQFIAAVSSGAVMAIGRVVGGGHKIKFIEASLVDETGRLIATASGAFKRASVK